MDINLKDKTGTVVTHENIKTLTFDTPSGEIATYTAGEAVEKTVDLHFINESNFIISDDEIFVNEMLTDTNNIGKYVKYEGPTNKYVKNTYYEIVASDEFNPDDCPYQLTGWLGNSAEQDAEIECNVGDLVIAMFTTTSEEFSLNEGWTLLPSSESVNTINSLMTNNIKLYFAYTFATSTTVNIVVKYKTQGNTTFLITAFSDSTGCTPLDYQYATGTGINSITVQRPQSPVILWGIYSDISVPEWTSSPKITLHYSKVDKVMIAYDTTTESSITFSTPTTDSTDISGENIIMAGALGIILPPCSAKAVSNLFIDNSQTINADKNTLIEKVVINKPNTLNPENIISGVNIAGVIGTYSAPKLYPPTTLSITNITDLNTINVLYPQHCNGFFGKKVQILLEDQSGGFEVVAEKDIVHSTYDYGNQSILTQFYANDFICGRPITTKMIAKFIGENIRDSDKLTNDKTYSIGQLAYNLENVSLDKEYEYGFYHDALSMLITPDSGYYLPKTISLSTPSGEVTNDYSYDYDSGDLVITPAYPELISVNIIAVDTPWLRTPGIDIDELSLNIDAPEYAELVQVFVNDILVYESSEIGDSSDVPVTVTAVSGASYGFVLGSDGYYVSNNKGRNSSYAICKIEISVTGASTLVLDCVSYGEPNYDYGLLSKLDTGLSLSYSSDADANLQQNFKGQSSSAVKTITYNIPAGTHYIYAKYIKDGSGNNYDDIFKFKVNTSLSKFSNNSVTVDLSQSITNYGAYNIGVLCKADGYTDSDLIESVIEHQPIVSITDTILSFDNIIDGVTNIQIYIDDILVDTVPYVSGEGIDLQPYMESLGLDAYIQHDVYVSAIGENVNANASEVITCYIASEPIYGVSGLYNSKVALTRTDDATAMTYTINSDGSIDSDFNDVFPWNEAEIVYDEYGNKFIQMPRMFFRVGTSGRYVSDIAVSKLPQPTGEWYEVQPFCYGCYGGQVYSNKLRSRTSCSLTSNYTRSAFRTYATANGEGYHQLDLYHLTVMRFLWLIEFATKNSDSIMGGRRNGSGTPSSTGVRLTGGTDSISTPSGYETVYEQMRWHYIEDFIGNLYEWVDGVCVGAGSYSHYAISDYHEYADSTTNMNKLSYANYHTNTGVHYVVMGLGWDSSNPFMCVGISNTTGTYTTYFCDGAYAPSSNSSYICMYTGASFSSAENNQDGLFRQMLTTSSGVSSYTGARLLYRGTLE